MGPAGKKILLSKINIPANFHKARLSTGSASKVCDQFSAVKSRTATTSIASQRARKDPPPTSLLSESSELYPCPGKCCSKSYCIRGFRHCRGTWIAASKSVPQKVKAMLDKAVRGYAAMRLQRQFTSVPRFWR